MHQLFLGVVKSLLELTSTWLKQEHKMALFGKCINELVQPIKTMQLSFCKIETFNGGSGKPYTTGGWVAESYVAFARLWPLIMGIAADVMLNKAGHAEFVALFTSSYDMFNSLMWSDDVAYGQKKNENKP